MTALRNALSRNKILADALQSRINALNTDFMNRDDPAQRAVIEKDRRAALAEMDRNYQMPMFRQLRRTLPMKPSDYYRRQCFLGASFLDENAAAARYQIGVDKLLWGSDYPHIEGTWPHTRERLQQVFSGVSREEVARMLGGNAARVYGFDEAVLAPLAAEFGPPVASIGSQA